MRDPYVVDGLTPETAKRVVFQLIKLLAQGFHNYEKNKKDLELVLTGKIPEPILSDDIDSLP
jgi:hypothetical protein